MTSKHKDNYFVAVKAFIEEQNKLLILKDNFGDWDLPGGRIKYDEFETPLEDILGRKLKEELGSEILYQIEKPSVFLRHQRHEAIPGKPLVRIFAVGYSVSLLKSDIRLSPRHTEMRWMDLRDFRPEEYFTGGWLKGVQEYLHTRKL